MQQLLLLTGAPGVGKRSVAAVLASIYGFAEEHVDSARSRSLADLLLDADARGCDVVVTWSQPPTQAEIMLSRHLGFDWVHMCGRDEYAGAAVEPRLVAACDRSGSSRTIAAIVAEIV